VTKRKAPEIHSSVRALAENLKAAGVEPSSPSTVWRVQSARARNLGLSLGRDGKLRPDRRIDTTQRDALILKLRAEGKSLRAIATEAGCSVGTVHRVINKKLENES
jgi:DNA-binding NarL/FixJ family response regulator